MVRRLKIANDKFEIFKKLVNDDYYGIFNTMKEVFMVSAGIGYLKKKNEKLEKAASGNSISYDVFNGSTDESTINAICLAETNDLQILLENDEKYDHKFTIIEEFANYGIIEIKEKVIDTSGNPIDNFAEFILEQEEVSSEKSEGERIIEKLSEDLF